MRGHRVGIALFWTLLNATDAIPWVINGWRSFASCEKRAGREASLLFEKAIGGVCSLCHWWYHLGFRMIKGFFPVKHNCACDVR